MIPPKIDNLSAIKLGRSSILLVILWLGFALRLYRLGADSLWYDETVSAFLASQPVVDLIAHTARDIHPPGYYLFLHFWILAAGQREFALAFFSLVFGLLISPLTYRLARYLINPAVATWSALLVAFSPYQVWYSQEVRMYTLGAALGLFAAYCGLRALGGSRTARRFWAGYIISAALGLYTLYYFAFLLLVLNSLFLTYLLRPTFRWRALRSLILADGLIFIAYLPWLPVVWWQATQPPVPAWRTSADLWPWPILLESLSAFSLGQSVEPTSVWPILLLSLALFILGFLYLCLPASTLPHLLASLRAEPQDEASSPRLFASPALFLFTYTFGPLLLIYLLSFFTPLYHVRYLFTYSPAFYIFLGAGLVWLMAQRRLWPAVIAASLFLAACFFSLYQYHFNPRYRADDYRAAVHFIQSRWQPGDVILINAGYVYPAFLYYTDFSQLERQHLVPYLPSADAHQPLLLQTGSVDGPAQLGWGDPRSDFYAMSAAETVTALEAVSEDFSRLWLLRAYDTVTDPGALIRTWLVSHTIPLEDEPFSGESNIRAQGFLLAGANNLSQAGEPVQFEDGMVLTGWSLPDQSWQAGQTVPVKLWWLAAISPHVDYKMSLKLWTSTGELAAQGQDVWPAGTLYRATTWPVGQPVYQPSGLTLPANLPPGQYWLNVELYHPETGLPLPRLDGADPVMTLGSIWVKN